MFRSALVVLVSCVVLVHANAHASERIVLDDETLSSLQNGYQRYLQKNALKMAEKEAGQALTNHCEWLQSVEEVSIPICDFECRPHHWKYVEQGENERVLKYVGKAGWGSQFLKWTDSAWVRVAGPKERFREGMYCTHNENYAVIDLDTSFSENVVYAHTRVELVDGVLLQLSSNFVASSPRTMLGEVKVSSLMQGLGAKVTLELWTMGSQGPRFLSSTAHTISAALNSAESIRVEAKVEADQQSLIILRLDPAFRDRAAKGETSGKLALHAATLRPK